MTLEELKTRCERQGFKYAYGIFKDATEPPHLAAKTIESDNFMADDRVYKKKSLVQLDYTYLDKNVEEQNKIEDIILGDIAWEKTDENYFPDEKCWQVSYMFEI